MIKVGLLGAGFMGSMHSQIYKLLPDAKLVAVADLDPKRADEIAKDHNAKSYADANSLLADENLDLDLIDICLPTPLHTQYALLAAKRGCNILCEKPFTLDLAALDEVIAAVEQAGVKLMVGQCIRFWPEYQFLKAAIDKEKYGKIQGAWFSRLSPLPTWSWEGWLLDPAQSGGAAFDMHIHDTDFILYLLGKPGAVSSTIIEDKYGPSHISTVYHYDNLMVAGECGWNYPASFPFKMQYRVICEEAVLVFDGAELWLYPYEGDAEKIELTKAASESAEIGGNISDLGGYYNEIEYLIACLMEQKTPKIVTPQSARESVVVTLAEIEAGKTGKTIKL